jgi:hypothetical protein
VRTGGPISAFNASPPIPGCDCDGGLSVHDRQFRARAGDEWSAENTGLFCKAGNLHKKKQGRGGEAS